MEEKQNASAEKQAEKQKEAVSKDAKCNCSGPAMIILVIIATALVVGGAVYFWQQFVMKSQKQVALQENQVVAKQLADMKKDMAQMKKAENGVAAPATQEAETEEVETVNIHTSFQKAVNSKDEAAMANLMTASVKVIIEATECCGQMTNQKATDQIAGYTKNAVPYNFDQNQQVVRQMKVNMEDYFGKYTIGIAANQGVFAYHVNDVGKVDDVYMSVTHGLLDLE